MSNGSVFNRKEHDAQWISISNLEVHWPEAQRLLSERNAKAIAASFDPALFGTITVSPLANGKYHVNDGWTRVSAVRRNWGDTEKVPCTVVPAADAQRAAEIFHKINGGRVRPTALEMFRTAVAAKFPTEVAVNDICTRVGLRVINSGGEGAIRACSALLSIYRQYGAETLSETLLLIRTVWGAVDVAAYDAQIMRGMADFVAQSDGAIDRGRLAKRLAKKFTPGRLLGAAKATREAFGDSMSRTVCHLVQEVYAPGSVRRKDTVVGERKIANG